MFELPFNFYFLFQDTFFKNHLFGTTFFFSSMAAGISFAIPRIEDNNYCVNANHLSLGAMQKSVAEAELARRQQKSGSSHSDDYKQYVA